MEFLPNVEIRILLGFKGGEMPYNFLINIAVNGKEEKSEDISVEQSVQRTILA